ncbi:MAG TPA: RecX family transcriptional regulator [Gaiellaceae bacterium]|nr:RecX family transcriptional regulator [Gaiellaceae bacterium]
MAPRLTALRRSRPRRIALEVDGRPWRVVPDDVVARCGLVAGRELERPLLRAIRRELRRLEALDLAARALRRRDLSRRRLTERLEKHGIAAREREGTLATLAEAGIVDDARAARTRARALAERGLGDAALEARLEADGFPEDLVRAAVSELPPESERARAAAAGAGNSRKAWAYLTRRGFSTDAIESALGALDEEG